MLDVLMRRAYAGNFMHRRWLAAAFVALALAASARAAQAADDATLLRVFLKDGTSLVSYGEPARVGDRVIFSMPTAAMPQPPLHLVDLSIDRVDWERTNRYASNARATHYLETRAELDYMALSNAMAEALNEVTLTADPARRLAIVEGARRTLAAWPENHYNYRLSEVRQMLSMLDEAIADLRASTGARRFDLTLSASIDPLTIPEPLLPPPSPKEAIEAVLGAARVVDSSVERASLLATALVSLERDKAELPADWVVATREATTAAIAADALIDRSYSAFGASMLTLAGRRARLADVRGLERLIARIQQRDAVLGHKRPETVNGLLAAVEEKLDAARRLQLARDRWALRAPVYREYDVAISRPMDLFARLKPSLENIKALSGSSPGSLATIERVVAQIRRLASAIAPPEEFAAAHALLVSAVHLAGQAAQVRRDAALAGDMARAWDASSAAAGALMLGARARTDIQTLLRPPQLR
jgi:hypothetical protein